MNIRPARRADAAAIIELLEQLGYPQGGPGATADRIQLWARLTMPSSDARLGSATHRD
jgi:hypothetical protein